MKINEKHLLSFASSHSPADKKGFLHKRGEVNKAFQRVIPENSSFIFVDLHVLYFIKN